MKLPSPPYYAVIFTSQRAGEDQGYRVMAQRMEKLASDQPGFLGIESYRETSGRGVTISYWDSEEAIQTWKNNAEHLEAQEKGKSTWYSNYELRIARVERAYAKK